MWRKGRRRRRCAEGSDPPCPQGGWAPQAPPSALFIPGARLRHSYAEPIPTAAPRGPQEGDGAGADGDAPSRTSPAPSPHPDPHPNPAGDVCGAEPDLVVRVDEDSSDGGGSDVAGHLTESGDDVSEGESRSSVGDTGEGECPFVGAGGDACCGCGAAPTRHQDERLLPGVHLPSVVAAASGSTPSSSRTRWSRRRRCPSRTEVARLVQCLCWEVLDEDFSEAATASQVGGRGGPWLVDGAEEGGKDPERGGRREEKETERQRSLLARVASALQLFFRWPASRARGHADAYRRHDMLNKEMEEEEDILEDVVKGTWHNQNGGRGVL